MKKMSILIMLLCMIFIATAVSAAEETNATEVIDESVDEVTEATNETVLSGESAQAFGAIHKKILMLTEEAFDYLLTGDEKNKQAFLDEYASLAEDYAAFEKTIDLGSKNTAELKVQYDLMVAATDAMGSTAETMFASYDANQTIVLEDVIAFEDEVDSAAMSAEAIWDLDDETDSEPISESSARSWLSTILLEAIEESYAYPVLGNETEKQDALAKFTEFEEILAMAQEQNPDVSFEDMITMKADLMKAAETLFASYEAEGAVNAEDLAALEAVVESFNETLSTAEISDESAEEVATVNLTEESDSVVNATA